jgi:branched-subunit amino acid ABC-type transport system permease component
VVVVGAIVVVVGAIVATFVIGALIALSMLESRDEAALEHP